MSDTIESQVSNIVSTNAPQLRSWGELVEPLSPFTSRREFLKTVTATGCGMLLAQSLRPSQAAGEQAARKQRIIVIGAGIAGLAAAGQLRASGFEVVVVEARRRLGGRIWTADLQGQPVDLGTQWIEGVRDNPIEQCCQQHGIKTAAHDEDSVRVFDGDGARFGDDEAERLHDQTQKLIEQTQALNQQRIANRQPDITMAEALRLVEANRPTTPRQTRYRTWVISAEVEAPEAETADRLSLRNYWAEDEQESFDGPHHLLPNGLAQVVAILAKGLDIRLGQPVTAIRWSNDGVEVVTGKETLLADLAVVTLPLGVLKADAVKFSPELPTEKRQAIKSLGVGAIHRIVLRFEKKFWRDAEELLGYASGVPGRLIEWWNLSRFIGVPILSLWSHGDVARRLEESGPQQAVTEAMQAVRVLFGPSAPQPTATLVTSWTADPFSRGAHVVLPVGASYDHLDALAAPVGNRLFFAGEATTRQHLATAHGAWLSGLHAAKAIEGARF